MFTLVEERLEEFDSPPIFDEPDDEEYVIYGDKDELLVIRRTLNFNPINDEVWLCNNIFHTCCTSHGKICDVIIDSESCEKMVAETMVQKLPLKIEKTAPTLQAFLVTKG
jgi:hypothetical protein